jgi:hypothetical protein
VLSNDVRGQRGPFILLGCGGQQIGHDLDGELGRPILKIYLSVTMKTSIVLHVVPMLSAVISTSAHGGR